MSLARVDLDYEDGVARVTLNDPPTLNAIGARMRSGLARALGEVEDRARDRDPEARCLLLTGAGRAFSSGAHLQDPDAPPRDREAEARGDAPSTLETFYNPLFLRLKEFPIPIVAAVNGVAAGVGMSLALAADMIVAARSACFLQAFARIGLVPDGGATWILPRRIGLARALELSLLAERLPAGEALAWGLVNQVVDDEALPDAAAALAGRLAAGPRSLGLIRRLYWQSLDRDQAEQLALEAAFQKEAGTTEDHAEGLAAFREKRPPRFAGR